MAVSRDFESWVVEQFAASGRVTSRPMFGGVGLYVDGTFVALIAPRSSDVYLRVDDGNRGRFEDAGMEAFRPWREKPTVMPFHRVPPEVLEDAEVLAEWVRGSLQAARRAQQASLSRRPRRGTSARTPGRGSSGRRPRR